MQLQCEPTTRTPSSNDSSTVENDSLSSPPRTTNSNLRTKSNSGKWFPNWSLKTKFSNFSLNTNSSNSQHYLVSKNLTAPKCSGGPEHATKAAIGVPNSLSAPSAPFSVVSCESINSSQLPNQHKNVTLSPSLYCSESPSDALSGPYSAMDGKNITKEATGSHSPSQLQLLLKNSTTLPRSILRRAIFQELAAAVEEVYGRFLQHDIFASKETSLLPLFGFSRDPSNSVLPCLLVVPPLKVLSETILCLRENTSSSAGGCPQVGEPHLVHASSRESITQILLLSR